MSIATSCIRSALAPVSQRPLQRLFAVAALGAALAVPMTAQAGVGEALEIELPSMRTPIPAQMSSPSPGAATSVGAVDAVDGVEARQYRPRTRAQVQNELALARLTNMLPHSGEIADTPEVLAAREAFNDLQAEVLGAEYAALEQQQEQQQQLPQRQQIANLAGLSLGQLLEQAAESGQPVVVLMFQSEEPVIDEEDDGI